MLVASEELTPPAGAWLRGLGIFVFLSGAVTTIILHGSTRFDFWPWEIVALPISWLVAAPFMLAYRRGGVGRRARSSRLARRGGSELTGTIRPIPGDPLAHAAPIATQRPRKDQPGYRALSARAFDLELDDGRRVRVEPLVAILDSPTGTVSFGTRVTLSPATADLGSYREAETVVRGTEEAPLAIRVEPQPIDG